ncbi:hypothetical protein [Corallococcus sp. Z5C101001]|uniref:hypothetical protein n=1 Tax=Corallococcus sp. Z5C101001 TaxID=2596829 RepID=UPI00117F928D|nr:hypothetical protein [Corallococcus sp. Z5C101001]TSC31934.1 hypothetical protein FOF48_15070 [Corallococcus sp. Z5C101001]
MNDEYFRAMLQSDDEFEVLRGLSDLGGVEGAAPGDDVMELALAYFGCPDADWRRQAVLSVSVHWAYFPSFPRLVEMLDEGEDVLGPVIMAIARVAARWPELKGDALLVLRRVFEERARPRWVGNLAYVCSRWMCGELDPVLYAKGISDPGG